MAKRQYGPPSMAGIIMFHDIKTSKKELDPKTVIAITVGFSAAVLILQLI